MSPTGKKGTKEVAWEPGLDTSYARESFEHRHTKLLQPKHRWPQLNTAMRAYELFETDFIAMGLYDPQQDDLGSRKLGDTRKPSLTLQHLHKLKHIRNLRRRELEKKLELVGIMYADPDLQQQSAEFALEHDRQKHDLEMLKDEIGLEIDAAKISKEQKDHIRKMAMCAAERPKKA